MFMDELLFSTSSSSKNSSGRNATNLQDDDDVDSDNLYDILGCDPRSNTEQIIAEYRVKAREFHPDKCQDPDEKSMTERKFCKLQRAKEILADVGKRRDYDKWRQSGLAISYRKWCSINATGLHCSMHWSNSNRNQQKALANVPNIDDNNDDDNDGSNGLSSNSNLSYNQPMFRWQSGGHTNSILKRFRNYEI